MSIKEKFNWAPLESDPSIFNEYFKKMGLPDSIQFNELYTIDYKEAQPIEGQVLSVIINYECNKQNPYHRKEDNYADSSEVTFYMKQSEELDYACGLIAAMHSIGNNLDKVDLPENSLLSNFFEASKNLSAVKRAELLCQNNDMKQVHDSHAEMGQTQAQSPQDVANHFVTFNWVDEKIYEFDGILKSVYLIKDNVNKNDFFDETLAEVSKRLCEKNITENLSIIFMSKIDL